MAIKRNTQQQTNGNQEHDNGINKSVIFDMPLKIVSFMFAFVHSFNKSFVLKDIS